MTEDPEKEGRGFKVQDRRRFSETGEARAESAEDEAATAPEAEPEQADPGAASEVPGGSNAAPEINFPTFVISLSTQALAHLGEIPDPTGGAVQVDLPAARQLIDILGMLQEKTAGNLDEDEARLLEHALYDLRMKYVERAQGN